jgi:hypothetical protein
MTDAVLQGIVIGLACALVGGLIVFVWMLYRDNGYGGGGSYHGYRAPDPRPMWTWSSFDYDLLDPKTDDVSAETKETS